MKFKILISQPLFWLNIIIIVFFAAKMVFGWTNPSDNPPTGGGVLYYSNGNVGIGTTAPDATFQVNGTMKIFGNWETKSVNTVYQAASDGFVTAWTSDNHIEGITDSASTPTTIRIRDDCYTGGYCAFSMPVRKGDYWKVYRSAGSAGVTVYWIPFGN